MGLEIAGAYLGYKASKNASKAQQEGAAQASAVASETADKQLALQRQIWEKQQADYKPYLEQGTWGINRLGDLMKNQTGQYQPRTTHTDMNGFNDVPTQPTTQTRDWTGRVINQQTQTSPMQSAAPSQNAANNTSTGGYLNNPFDSYLASKGLSGGKFDTTNPAYQFQLQQGQRALDSSAAARGMGYSGAQMKASQQYGQGLASQEYDKQYNRASGEFGDYYNRLSGLAQGGQQATSALSNAGNQYATGASNTLGSLGGYIQNNLGQAANARASGYVGGANAINNGIQSMTNNAFRLFGMGG
jgi:hypothetical protein